MKNPFTSIRKGFADAKVIISAIPTILAEFRKDPARAVAQAKIHEMVDNTFEAYGDTITAICSKIDLTLIENIITDVVTIAAKYEEPLKEQVKVLSDELEPVMERYTRSSNKLTGQFNKIISKIAKDNKWDERFKIPSVKEAEAKAAENLKTSKKAYEEEKTAKEKEKEERLESIKSHLRCTHWITTWQMHNEGKSEADYEQFLDSEASVLLNRATGYKFA